MHQATPSVGLGHREGARLRNEYLVERKGARTGRPQAIDIPRAGNDLRVVHRKRDPEHGGSIVGRGAGEAGACCEPLRVIDTAGETPTPAHRPSAVDASRDAGRREGTSETGPVALASLADL